MRALFGRKISNLEELKWLSEQAESEGKRGRNYTVTKEVHLNDEEFKAFTADFLADQDWISPDDGGPSEDGDRCIRVINIETDEKILVNTEGFSYPRYTAIEQ